MVICNNFGKQHIALLLVILDCITTAARWHKCNYRLLFYLLNFEPVLSLNYEGVFAGVSL